MDFNKQLKTYQIATIITILLTLVGFSYNVWRLEQSERNSNIRTSSFELIKQLAQLEQIVYYAHYDKDTIKGNPRTGWIKVIIINDLCLVAENMLEDKANKLKITWQDNWQQLATEQKAADNVVQAIDDLRTQIQTVLRNLE